MTKPYEILTSWKWGPKGRRASNIGENLTAITAELGLVPFQNNEIKRNPKAAWFDYNLHAEVRMTAEKGSEGEGWHQDGDTSTKNMDCALVLWASAEPTEFKWSSWQTPMDLHSPEIFQPEPFELVIAKNLEAYHRRPDSAVDTKRFIFRQRVEIPDWL